jgi:hypothetical protein
MNKATLGIDVGSKGVICLQYNGEFSYYYISDNDLYQLSKIMAEIRNKHEDIACVIEDVQAIYGSAASATFTFGFNKGYLIGLLCANNIPYTLVQAKQWQKEMWSNSDIVVKYKKVIVKDKKTKLPTEITKKSTNTKETSYNAAKRLFPQMDFRKTQRCISFDDNKVDATLMSEYARRKNL